MRYAMIGTWEMALAGVRQAHPVLAAGGAVGDAIEAAIRVVEDNPAQCSVGYGGLPNLRGEVELDAAYMDGDTFHFGAMMGARFVKNPIAVARALSARRRDCVICGRGAEEFAAEHGFEMINMLTASAKERWEKQCAQRAEEAYQAGHSHDTVCMVGFDEGGHMAVGVSTSGLFMKQPGRVGDSPIIGSGYYCDTAVGGAAATGLGEDIMRGCLSYEVVRAMREGLSAQAACERTLYPHLEALAARGYVMDDSLSLIAMDAKGGFGAASSLPAFPFAVVSEQQEPALYMVVREQDTTRVIPATQELLAAVPK